MNFQICRFPRDVLQRIFKIGVKQVWCLSHVEMEELEDDSEDEELDVFVGTNRSQKGYPDRFKPDHDPFLAHPELVTLMDCSQVCTTWADAITDKKYWDSLSPETYGKALSEPWKLGKRWNQLLNNVPVPILCVKGELLSNIGKIYVSILRGRDAFEVYLPSHNEQKQQVFEAWFNLQPILQTRCVHLTITNPIIATGRDRWTRKRVDFLPLTLTKWPLLQSLDIDTSATDVFTRETIENWKNFVKKLERDLGADPPFPTLKRLSFATYLDTQAAQDITLAAPVVEHFRIHVSTHEDEDLQRSEPLRTSRAHLQFLREDKCYRTYVLPFCINAFKWPGPKTIRNYEELWEFQTLGSIFPQAEVLISEKRDGKICELYLTFSQCFEVEDLRLLSIPFLENL